MNEGINLLKGSKTKRFKEEKKLRYAQIVAVASLFFVSAFSALAFYVNTNTPLTAVVEEENQQKKIMDQLQDTAAKLFITQNRIKDIGVIINKREVLNTVLGDIGQAVPESVKIQSLALDGKNFSMTVSSFSLSELNSVLTNLVSMAENKKIFSKITLEGLSIDTKENNYIVSLSGNLP